MYRVEKMKHPTTATILFFLYLTGLAGRVAASPTPPEVPLSTAQILLANLTIGARGPLTGYSRTLFPQWIEIANGCNTRQEVLKRDGQNVVTGSGCKIESGTWLSPYDGETITNSTLVQIDHLVPLALAWMVSLLREFLPDEMRADETRRDGKR
jgi:hypothetical protein